MIPLSLYEIASIVNAKYVGLDLIINEISINSKFIKKKCLFIALIGDRYDGHDFAEQAIFAGARAILVNRYLSLNIPQLIVIDTYNAFVKIASWVRRKVSPKVIAITGSSGKTSVKEITASILKNCGNVIATKGNCNNLIGVPMTLLDLTYQTNFAVIELGTNRPGELKKLSKMVFADVALVNNIFASHLLGFRSLSILKKEKGEIFSELSDCGQAVINADNHAFSVWNTALKSKKVWHFSLYKRIRNDFFVSKIVFVKNGVQFILHSPCGTSSVFLSMLGEHNIANALAASALSFAIGLDFSRIIYGLRNVKMLPGRLFPIVLNKGKLLLLDDTYNSNVGSMIAAINVLSRMPGYRILVLSDMLELGECEQIKYHYYIGRYLKKTNIDQILTIGDISYIIFKICNKPGRHFQDKNKLILYLNNILFRNQNITLLIKGSRKFKMEFVVNAIKDKSTC